MLIVDDNMLNVELLGSLMAEHGNRFESALSGTQAISLIMNRFNFIYKEGKEMFRLILVDYNSMQDMNAT